MKRPYGLHFAWYKIPWRYSRRTRMPMRHAKVKTMSELWLCRYLNIYRSSIISIERYRLIRNVGYRFFVISIFSVPNVHLSWSLDMICVSTIMIVVLISSIYLSIYINMYRSIYLYLSILSIYLSISVLKHSWLMWQLPLGDMMSDVASFRKRGSIYIYMYI
jgi:hypothetical protein